MKKILLTILLVIPVIAFAHGNNLWEHFGYNLPSIQGRAELYLGNDVYEGTEEQNTSLLSSLHTLRFGSLAPLPGPTSEGTTTAGWTDDGSIVRLNTASDNVGIGTANPTTKLQVQGGTYLTGTLDLSGGTINFSNGNATTALSVLGSGFLGIGTTTPRAFLGIGGNIMSNGTSTFGTLVLASSSIQIRGTNYILPSADGTNGQALTTNGARTLSFNTVTVTSAESFSVATSTASPLSSLTVGGGALISGTTTVGNLVIASTTNSLTINNQSYKFPAIRGASSTVLTEDGAGNLAFQLPGYTLLISSSTPVATSTMLFNLPASSTQLKIVINIPSTTGGRPYLIFNGDFGSNYGFEHYVLDGSVPVNAVVYSAGGNGGLEIQPDANGTTTPQIFVTLEGSNRAANRKQFSITGSTQLAGSQPPVTFNGSGIWNNTATQISSVLLYNSSGINNDFAAGTFVRIYGSND